jgi:uncharacterized glyoxalase superfamily protein PhnB
MTLRIGGLCPLLQVFDMPTAIAFYRPADDQCDWALLGLQGSELMLNTAYEADQRPAIPDPVRLAAHRDTTLFFDCPDLDAAYEYLLNKGVDPNPPVDRDYGMRQLYFSDPDGYEICLQHPSRI